MLGRTVALGRLRGPGSYKGPKRHLAGCRLGRPGPGGQGHGVLAQEVPSVDAG